MRPLAATVLVSVTMIGSIAAAQDNMLRNLDFTTPDMTHAEMSRADIDALISGPPVPEARWQKPQA